MTDDALLDKLDLSNPDTRRYIVEQYGLAGFTWVYLSHHFNLEPADFHPELIDVFEDPAQEMVNIIGFRGSAKSTYGSLAVPLYFALEHKHDFILPVGDTGTQMKLNIANIRYELENNPMILKDYGLAYNPDKNWSDSSLQLNNGVLIMGRSRGQKIRGLKHRQYRPQVIICDDLEDTEWVKKKENRDKTERWLTGEVIPAQQETKAKLILIGNLVHNNAIMARMEAKKKGDGTPLFKTLRFALIDKGGHCTWRGKYPDDAALQKQKEKVGSATAWSREYLLKIIAEEDQIIKETDISYYPVSMLTARDERNGRLLLPIVDAGAAQDLAISEKKTADFTAIVRGYMVTWTLDAGGKVKRLLIRPKPFNKRVDFDGAVAAAKDAMKDMPMGARLWVEDVMYQKAAVQTIKKHGVSVFGVKPVSDKRARLMAASPFIKDGTVMFPETGCEELIEQLVGFGSEEHDDLVDALVYLILALINKPSVSGGGKAAQL